MKNKTGSVNYDRWIVIFFSALVFILYSNTLRNGYSLDDDFVIEGNSQIQQGFGGIPGIFLSPYSKELRQRYGYRPVTLMTFAIEYELFGLKPPVSHLINILLYLLTCILLFRLLTRLLSEYTKWLSFLIVFFFMIHPLHTEVVNNIKNRDELLAFFFSLFSLNFFLKYYETGNLRFLFYGLIIFLAAILSKLSALPFMAVIPATLYFFRKMHRLRLAFLILAIGLFPVLMYLLKKLLLPVNSARINFYFENPLFFTDSVTERIPAAFITLGYYLRLLFYPHPLSFYYGYDHISVIGWSNHYLWGGIAAVTLFTFLFLKGIGKKTFPAYCVFVFAAFISPFLNLVRPVSGIIGERLSYSASFAFSCLFAFVLLKIFRLPTAQANSDAPIRPAFWGILVLLLTCCALKIISRNPDWKDRLTLYRHDIAYLEKSAKAHSLLGDASLKAAFENRNPSLKQNLLAESESHYKKALKIFPEYPMTLNNLGSIYFMFRKDYPKSKEYFERAVKADIASPEANFNLGLSLLKLNDTLNAVAYFKEAVHLYPQYHDALRYLSSNTLVLKQYEESLEAGRQAIRFFPSEGLFILNSGKACLGMKDTLKAIGFFEKLIAHPQREYREEAESMLQLLK